MSVLLRAENAQDIIVLVNGLSKVTPLLFIPPLGIGVAELAFDRGRVGVVSVLQRQRAGSANFATLAQSCDFLPGEDPHLPPWLEELVPQRKRRGGRRSER